MSDDDEVARENVTRLFDDAPAANVKQLFPKSDLFGSVQKTKLSGSDLSALINKHYAMITINGQFKVLHEKSNGEVEFLSKDSFISTLAKLKTHHQEPDGEFTKPVAFAIKWLVNPFTRQYQGVEFDPSKPVVPYDFGSPTTRLIVNSLPTYNFWKGWKLEPKEGDITPFRDFMYQIMCSTSDGNCDYLAALIAQMFQEPWAKPGIAAVIRGDEGVGKSFFVEALCHLMEGYYFKTSNPDHVFGAHNSQLKNVLLLHLEEAIWAGSKKDESLMKDLVTGPTIEINEKFVPVYSVTNHLHLFITGNPDWLVSASFKARRIFALHASDARRRDTEYFATLSKWLNAGGYAALMNFFLNYKYGVNLRIVPVTTELIEQKKRSMSGLQKWVVNCVELGEWPYGVVREDGCVEVIKKLLIHSYNTSPEGQRHQLSDNEFGTKFCEMFPLIVNGVIQKYDNLKTKSIIQTGPNIKFKDNNNDWRYGYIMPPLRPIRDVIDATLGGQNNWDDKAEWTTDKANVSDLVDSFKNYKRPF